MADEGVVTHPSRYYPTTTFGGPPPLSRGGQCSRTATYSPKRKPRRTDFGAAGCFPRGEGGNAILTALPEIIVICRSQISCRRGGIGKVGGGNACAACCFRGRRTPPCRRVFKRHRRERIARIERSPTNTNYTCGNCEASETITPLKSPCFYMFQLAIHTKYDICKTFTVGERTITNACNGIWNCN